MFKNASIGILHVNLFVKIVIRLLKKAENTPKVAAGYLRENEWTGFYNLLRLEKREENCKIHIQKQERNYGCRKTFLFCSLFD